MGLNIKDETVHKLAKELAELTGESMTGAIRRALEEKLLEERATEEMRVAERLRRIREITGRIPPPPPGVTSDVSDFYDEDGLPA